MAVVDLANLQKSVITRDLSNKYILLAAPQKFGKTTFMCNIPNALVLGFEPGTNAKSGVYVQRIDAWTDVKSVVKQLHDPANQERFKTICFDTVEIAAQLCQDFVCIRSGVQSLSEVPYGKLYKEYELEFSKTIREIASLGYGMVFSCHTEIKEIGTNDSDAIIERIQPKLDKRAFDIVNSLVDIIGIGVMEFDEKGNQKRMLYTSQTPNVWAGNRFTYFPPKIDFSYQAVLDNLVKAIEAEGENNNATIVDELITGVVERMPFEEIRRQSSELWKVLTDKDPNNAQIILKKTEMIFGHRVKLSEITEDQSTLFELVLDEMKEMNK